MKKKEVDVVVISDVHLGTYGCHARELTNYLKSIKPEILIINGDFIDAWQFRKRYFPKEHMEVIHQVIKMSVKGTKVFYITGNHDDILRRITDISAGNIHLRDKIVLQFNNEKYWIFHGDIFDFTILTSPFLGKLGGSGYNLLILINRTINKIRIKFGMQPVSFASKVKSGVKRAIKFIDDYEKNAVKAAHEKGFDYVVCGHIHQPKQKEYIFDNKKVTYLNSGDWVENLTALEFRFGKWEIYKYDEADYNLINNKLIVNSLYEDAKGLSNSIKGKAIYKRIMDQNESELHKVDLK